MKAESARAIVEAASVMGGMDVGMRPDYSGRGMYGSQTAAITCDSLGDFIKCVAYAGSMLEQEENELTVDDFVEDVGNVRIDQFGHGHVFY